uniref:small monomeric GTPase n=1 Tax=Neovison vison TaxID=452646 RepID=A0A8C7BQ03_NEOVI
MLGAGGVGKSGRCRGPAGGGWSSRRPRAPRCNCGVLSRSHDHAVHQPPLPRRPRPHHRLRTSLFFLDCKEAGLIPREDAYKIRIRIDDEPANLDILDTAGQAEFTAMRDQYMRAGEGFIICYSITDRRSFHEVREFKQLIYRVRRTDDTPVVLVGNKSDLKQLRQVTKEEGLALAREFSCPFFETSAAYRYYIDDVFHALVREIRRKEKEAVLAMEKKSKPKASVWKRLKSPFRKKKDSVT